MFFALLSGNISLSQNFNKSQIKSLFEKFNKQTQTPFSYKILEDFLKDIKIEDLKKGKEFEKEVLFENFDCECKDVMKISFDKTSKTFILKINEASFVQDLDWCPEHTYIGSFKIKEDKIVNTEFNLVAG
ncbi:hypothetical protein M9Q43_01760 [Flavobacterium sp. HXWNR29]|uniref:hypothetical protein n=1 Tax=Flavobacterium odoriferum TaxID=2946604 RepID=UPI0021CB866A|nr:hypothetical protein [Flavobacterium sp. HXWNR29]MCU4187886.1 hypothetical protein [Flavobacterium sp. HXWNR29]